MRERCEVRRLLRNAKVCGAVLALTISAPDRAERGLGIEKYRRTWEPSINKWYEGEARVELVQESEKW